MSPIYEWSSTNLEILHWVPVMLDEYDCVSSSEIQAQASNMSS